MNYLNYLKEIFPDYEITEEVNYQWNGVGTAMIVKYLNGTNYRDSKIQPVQLAVYSDDIQATKSQLDIFSATYNNVPFVRDFEYVQQIYSTPMVLSSFDITGNTYTHQFIITATLIISTNVNDIKKVTIDGSEYETTTRILNYVAVPDSQRVSGEYINQSDIMNAMVKFTCTFINKNGELFEKIRRMREGNLAINTVFTIELTYYDNDYVETYLMKLDSSSINSENQSLPILSLSFIK